MHQDHPSVVLCICKYVCVREGEGEREGEKEKEREKEREGGRKEGREGGRGGKERNQTLMPIQKRECVSAYKSKSNINTHSKQICSPKDVWRS